MKHFLTVLAVPLVVAVLLVHGAPAWAQDRVISGSVRDATGGAIVGASVTARVASGAERQTTSDAAGRFSIAPPADGPVTLIVRAPGFAEWRTPVGAPVGGSTRGGSVEVLLQAAQMRDDVTVTPTRSEQGLGNVPASVSVIRREDIQRRAAVVPDDLLRQLPEFSLFRRASSLSAHPTSQGVSLRGIGPSGVSRSLVLLDGVPFNDAFGGWVYWTALPMESAERIEVVNGASSSLYGSYAMGGVLNIVTRPPARRSVAVRTQYGSRQSPKIDVSGSDVWGKVGVSIDGSAFDTDGYQNVLAVAARAGRHRRGRAVRPSHGEGRLQPERSRAGVRAHRLLQRDAAQRQDHHGRSAERGDERHDLAADERRRAAAAARLESAPGDDVRRVEDVRQQLPGDSRCDGRALDRAALAESDGADRCRRRHGAVVALARQAARADRRHGLPLGRRRQHRGCVRRGDRFDADHASRGRRHAAIAGRVRAGRVRAREQRHHHRERAARSLAQLRCARHRDDAVDGRGERSGARRQERLGGQPAGRRAVSPARSRVGVGRHWRGLPRADAERAVSALLAGRGGDARERGAGAGAAGRRRAGRQRDPAAARHLADDVVRQPREGSGRQRHHHAAEPAAAAEPRTHPHLGRADRRRLSHHADAARRRRLHLRRREGARERRQSGARRPPARAGADASRRVPGHLHRAAPDHGGARRPGLGRAVRRRPEHAGRACCRSTRRST